MNYNNLRKVLLLCVPIYFLGWTSLNSQFATAPRSKLVERVVRLPSGNRCSLCQFSNVCFKRGHITFPPDSRSLIREYAAKKACELRQTEELQFMQRSIVFQRAVEEYKNDLLNPVLLSLQDTKKSKRISHMPHYVQFSLLSAIRSATLIELGNVRIPDPLLLTPKSVVQGQWFDGVHDAFKIVFNGTQEKKEEEDACFRSIYVSECNGVAPETVFFQKRIAALNGPRAGAVSSKIAAAEIQVRILSRVGSRRILNVEQVADTIRKAFANELKYTRLQIKLLQFEKKPFQYQMEEMMTTDVLVASHGAGLTNIMFMREGSSVIEILPFGMVKIGFRRESRLAGLHYEQIVAPADVNRVEKCGARKMLDEEFWRRWKLALSGQVLRVGTDTTERSCLRRQDLRVPEEELRVALERVVKRYQGNRGQ